MINLVFLVISNFISCSYQRNFTVFELLKRPMVFKGSRQENFFVVSVPKGLPWEETVLVIEGVFTSKLKDLAIKKGAQSQNDQNNFILIDAQSLEVFLKLDDSERLTSCQLVYSPWYRFVSEPFEIGEVRKITSHILGCISYFLRSKDIKSKIEQSPESGNSLLLEMSYSGFNRITISENGSLEWIKVIGPQDFSELNLVEKKVRLCKAHEPHIFSALSKVPLDSLKNIKITKSENVIELAYEK